MPTPFSHLAIAQRLLKDLPPTTTEALVAQRPAYVLGSVAADARPDVPEPRKTTHFYAYDEPMLDHPWRTMLQQHPQLRSPSDPALRAFVAGYVAHLATDEVWTVNMLGPHFANSEWGESRQSRFFVLHILLSHMDERDLANLEPWGAADIRHVQPNNWLPFLPDDVLIGWRDLIHEQIRPGGHSQTLEIFAERVDRPVSEFRDMLDDPAQMQRNLWNHIPRYTLAEIETAMYAHAKEALLAYMEGQ